MKLKWLGHAAFMITPDSGIRVITDPYEAGAYDGGVGYSPIADAADIVTVSHEHADHNGVAEVSGSPVVVRKTGKYDVKGIPIEGILTCHDCTGGRERGLNTVFCLTIDGIRLCHLGDLGHELSPKELAAIGRPDVLLIPVGGYFTIDAATARKIAEALKPKIVVPMHYKTDKLNFPVAGVEEFIGLMKHYPVKHIRSSEVELSRTALPAATEVWVLQYAR